MSVFDFINQKTTPSPNSSSNLHLMGSPSRQPTRTYKASPTLSVSLADELFDTISSDSKRPTPHSRSSTTSSLLSPAPEQASPQQTQQHWQSMSAFDFINQSPSVDTGSVDELVFATKSVSVSPRRSQQSPSPHRQQPGIGSSTQLRPASAAPDVQRVYEETTWKKISSAKENQLDLLRQLYDQRKAAVTMIQQNTTHIRESGMEKEDALAQQDYKRIHELEKQLAHWKSDIVQGTRSLQHLTMRIQREWTALIQLLRNQGTAAAKVASVYESVLNDRQQQAKQYQHNMDLQYQRQQEDIQQERESLASEKSELAFDLDFLKQASIELEEKMADAVHDEKEQKAELMEKMASIDGEIQDLMARIAKLKDQRQQYQQQVDDVDRRIEHALTTFLPDQQQHRIEHHDIERRKEKLQIQERQLDQRDAQFHQVRQRAQEMQAKEQQELKTMQEMMELAQTQAQTNGSHVATLTRLLDECIGIRDKSLVQALGEQQRLGKAIEQQQEKIRQARKEWWAMQERMEDSTATIEALQMKQTRLDRQIQRALQQGFYDVATSHQAEIKRINASLDERAQEKQEYQKQLNSQQQHIDTLQLTLDDMEHDNDQQWQQTHDTIVSLLNDAKSQLAPHDHIGLVHLELENLEAWQSVLK